MNEQVVTHLKLTQRFRRILQNAYYIYLFLLLIPVHTNTYIHLHIHAYMCVRALVCVCVTNTQILESKLYICIFQFVYANSSSTYMYTHIHMCVWECAKHLHIRKQTIHVHSNQCSLNSPLHICTHTHTHTEKERVRGYSHTRNTAIMSRNAHVVKDCPFLSSPMIACLNGGTC